MAHTSPTLQVKEYLEFLQQKDLVRYQQGTSLYKLTEKGLHYLRAFDQINEIISVGENARAPTQSVNEASDL